MGFVGYGDADPSNVSPMVRGAEMRVAETRAVNRALRKAYGIGICSVEELGTSLRRLSGSRKGDRFRSFEWKRLAQTSGQALPSDSKVRTRSHPRETLCG